MTVSIDTRLSIYDLYAEYAACIDEDRIDVWPEFFVEDCFYQIIPRSNYDNDMVLSIWRCESRGMLQDRINAIRETIMFEPRYIRHMISGIRITDLGSNLYSVKANYLVMETLADEFTKILNAGRYEDKVIKLDAGFKFTEKHCVYDSELIPNSIIYPV